MEERKYYMPQLFEDEAEKASNSYLMTVLIVMMGLPLPIINVIGSVVFWFAHRKQKSYFVRFHTLQSMLSQLAVVPVNSTALSWTIAIIVDKAAVSNYYIAYIITAIVFNIIEFVTSLYSAIQTRKKKNVRYLFFAPLAERICKKEND